MDNKRAFSIGAVIALACFAAAPAHADKRFGLGVSQWGLADSFDITTLKLSFEFGEIEKAWGIRIGSNAFYNFDTDSYYVSVGWLKEWTINPKWSWGLGGDAGYFSGDTLGYEIEFYTRGVLNYHLSESGFVRGEVGHISNAGFGDRNPGSENIAITYNWVF